MNAPVPQLGEPPWKFLEREPLGHVVPHRPGGDERDQLLSHAGEILLREFVVEGTESGDVLQLPASGRCELRASLEWTYPLEFAEVIAGDGTTVHRQRIDLRDTGPFGRRALTRTIDLAGKRWVRFEVWDVAANGAYTQPVWLEPR